MKWCTFTASHELAYELIGRMARRNTQRCTCERKRVPEWTDKRFAMCENRFFHSILICFRNSRQLRPGEWETSKCFAARGENDFGKYESEIRSESSDEEKSFSDLPRRLAPSPFRTSVGKFAFSSWPPKGGKFFRSVEIGSWSRDNRGGVAVIIEFAYKRVRIETCCKQGEKIPFVVSDKSLPGEIIVQ